MPPLLSVQNLSVSYGGLAALRALTVAVGTGEIFALIGANGAGKSTALRAVLGLAAHDGLVRLGDLDLSGAPAERRAAAGIGYCPEGRRVFGGMTVRENLEVACDAPGPERRRRIDAQIDLFPDLAGHLDRRASTLPGGQQQMLAFARALVNAPRLLLLDEPFTGLSPILAEAVGAAIVRSAQEGVSVLLADLPDGRGKALCDGAAVLRRGETAAIGDPAAQDLSLIHISEPTRPY